jgi:aspartyl aminopeptidase
MVALFDNEEIGSATCMGAASALLPSGMHITISSSASSSLHSLNDIPFSITQ